MRLLPLGSVVRGLSRCRLFSALLLALLAAAIVAPAVLARPTEPTRGDRNIAMSVGAMVDRKHLSTMRVDDEVSRRTLEMYLKSLDPRKLYFYQSDVEQFQEREKEIDDYVRSGKLGFAKRLFDLYLQRLDERVDYALTQIEVPHDFAVDETIVADPEKTTYAATEAEMNEKWRKRVKYELLVFDADGVESDEAKEKLTKRYTSLRRRLNQTDNDELLELFLSSLTKSFDPHSSYMSPSTLENFNIQMRLELNGIGASLESKYGETIVRRIVPGGAADKDGRLAVGDIITGVAQGANGELIDIVDMKINDVVQLIRGEPGTIVRLEVKPEDKSGMTFYDITRARIELKDSEARSEIVERVLTDKGLVDPNAPAEDAGEAGKGDSPEGQVLEGQTPAGATYRIGVIDLPSFYMDMEGRRAGREDFKSTSRDVRRLLNDFNKQGVDLVIMDLRFNGGGSLPESVDTTGLFIDQGPVVQVKGPDGRVLPYDDRNRGEEWSGPLIVLINHFSASASEIFAGAIQDYGRGIIVGDQSTHGKGTVQQLFDLGDVLLPIRGGQNMGALKLTIQQFYRPSGDSTQNRGVVSDIELPSRTTHWEVGEADLDYAMAFDQVRPLPHRNYPWASPQVIQELRRRSDVRTAEAEYFQDERQAIEKYLERKEDPTVTLNKEKFLAEREEVNTEKDQEEVFEDMQDEDKPVFESTPYNDEVMAIAVDYLNLLRERNIAKAR
ncbi:MAG: carboxy terminal-processing peptidase [Planctomycetota bacterium]